MIHRAFTTVSALSLLLDAATLWFWSSSYLLGWAGTWEYTSRDMRSTSAFQIGVSGGGLRVAGNRISEQSPTNWNPDERSWRRTSSSEYPTAPPYAFSIGRQWAAWHHRRPLGHASLTTWGLIVPCWAVCLVLSIFPALWLWKRRGHHTARNGTACPVCGYDLRATRDRCPECGELVTKNLGANE